MTSTPPEAPPPPPPTGDPGPRVTGEQIRDLGRLRRSSTDRKVAGVAGGLGRHLDVDPLILRVAFVVLVFFGGAGLILYGACWLLVPADDDVKAPFHLDERTRSVALLIVGAVAALALIGDSWGAFWFPWPVAIVALIALWLLTRNNQQSPGGSDPSGTPSAASPPPTAYPPPYGHYGQHASGWVGQPTAPYQPAVPQPPTSYVPPTTYVRAPHPRKRGPILFWFTLALIALLEGVLGIVDVAGVGVADPAYPALAVAICGTMLLVGAFFGRAGGIIALGLVASVGLAGATAADQWDAETVRHVPTSASTIEDRYWLAAGEQVLDLREVDDLESLDGQVVEIEGGVGRIEVLLPAGLAATVVSDVNGPGNIKLDGEDHGGIDISRTDFLGSHRAPEVTIDAQLGVGEIEVSFE